MTGVDELRKRRSKEALRIRTALNRQRGEQRAKTKGGEGLLPLLRRENALVATNARSFAMMTPSTCTTLTSLARSCRLKAIEKRKFFEMIAPVAGFVFFHAQPTPSQ